MTNSLRLRLLLMLALVVGGLSAASLAGPTIDVWAPLPSPSSSVPDGSQSMVRRARRISILTFNLKTGTLASPDHEARTNAVRSFIRRREPDAVALQEVSKRTGVYPNLGERLAEQTGYEFRWRRTHSIPYLYEEGIAILSRWPISSSRARSLPYPEAAGAVTRAVLGARIEHPARAFDLFVTHMTVDGSPDKKIAQIDAIRSFVRARSRSTSSWLVGDFNAEPDSAAIERVLNTGALRPRGETWVDAWHTARPGNQGATVPAGDPRRRIDYIFTVRHNAPRTATRCERVLDRPIRTSSKRLYPSDHLGVYCSFPATGGVNGDSREWRAGVQ